MHKCIYLDFLLIRKRPVPNTKEHLQFGELRNLASGNSPSTFQCIVKFWGVKSNYYRNLYIIGDQGDQICSGHGYAPLPSASVYKCMDGALVFTLHLQGDENGRTAVFCCFCGFICSTHFWNSFSLCTAM